MLLEPGFASNLNEAFVILDKSVDLFICTENEVKLKNWADNYQFYNGGAKRFEELLTILNILTVESKNLKTYLKDIAQHKVLKLEWKKDLKNSMLVQSWTKKWPVQSDIWLALWY